LRITALSRLGQL